MNEDVSIGVIMEDASFQGQKTYEVGTTIYTITNLGTVSITGIRVLHTAPVFKALRLGLEIATITFNSAASTYTNTLGTGVAGDWGGDTALFGTHPLLGFMCKYSIISSESDTLNTDFYISAGLRLVDIPDTYALGTNQTLASNAVVTPVRNFHNYNLIVGINLGF